MKQLSNINFEFTDLKYRPDLDGLRAIAVLAVLFCHAKLFNMHGGFVGVDVFFVISGFLMTKIIYGKMNKGNFNISDFFERRIRRIIPVLATVVFTSTVYAYFLFLPDNFISLGKMNISIAFFLSNIQCWRESGYFSPSAEELPLMHTWSLGVEEQFYLMYPFFLYYTNRIFNNTQMIQFLVLIMIASFALSCWGVFVGTHTSFYFLPFRAWELLLGSVLAFIHPKSKTNDHLSSTLIGLLGLSFIVAPCFVYNQNTPFPGALAAIPVIGCSLVILSGQFTNKGIATKLLSWSPLRYIGLISYSIYLWHWPIFAFARYQTIDDLSYTTTTTLILLTFSVSIFSYKFIETPFRSTNIISSKKRAYTCFFS